MKQLHIARSLALPLEAVTQKIAILGTSGSGKSYCMTKLAEEMLDAHVQVVILDPKSEAWGLRLKADGKTPAYAIPVLGGEHGDAPLRHDMGERVAELIVENDYSMVLDVSEFITQEWAQFGYDFATRLLQLKKRKKSAMCVMIDEAHDFIPQNPGDKGWVPKMLGAFERLQKLGRALGVGLVLASQRPQEVNKKALNLCELWATFQLVGTQERDAVIKTIGEKDREAARAIDTLLPTLEIGHAYVWSPRWLKVSDVYRVLEKKTFDSSATPEVGARAVEPRQLSPVDLESLAEALEDVIEEAKERDPDELARRLRESEAARERLQRELEKARKEVRTEPVEVAVITDEQIAHIQEVVAEMGGLRDVAHGLTAQLAELKNFESSMIEGVRRLKEASLSPNPPPSRVVESLQDVRARHVITVPPVREAKGARQAAAPEGADGLSPTAQAFLDVLNQYDQRNRQQLAILAGYSPTSGGVNKALAQLRAQGLAEGPESALRITPEGRARAKPAVIRRGRALLDYWRSHTSLTPTAAAFLVALYEAHPLALSRDELAEQCGYSPTSGGVNKALALLRKLELASGKESALRISEEFFE